MGLFKKTPTILKNNLGETSITSQRGFRDAYKQAKASTSTTNSQTTNNYGSGFTNTNQERIANTNGYDNAFDYAYANAKNALRGSRDENGKRLKGRTLRESALQMTYANPKSSSNNDYKNLINEINTNNKSLLNDTKSFNDNLKTYNREKNLHLVGDALENLNNDADDITNDLYKIQPNEWGYTPFDTAFGVSRGIGDSWFNWNGKKYGTRLKNEEIEDWQNLMTKNAKGRHQRNITMFGKDDKGDYFPTSDNHITRYSWGTKNISRDLLRNLFKGTPYATWTSDTKTWGE